MTLPRRSLLLAASGLLSACSPVSILNTLSATRGERRLGLAYGPDPRHRVDVYLPAPRTPPAAAPAVLFFYGGSWNRGERADYRFVGEALASRGIVCAVADYRLYPQVRYPDFLRDGALALAWLLREAADFGADPRRVYTMGHSAGGYNAAMLALDARWLGEDGVSPQRLAGWIGLAGAYDFLPIGDPDARPVFFHPNYPPDSQVPQYVHAGAPPAFLGAARSDTLVDPERNTVGLAERLRAAGVPVELKLYDRVNHMLLAGALGRPLRWLAPVLDDVSGFVLATPPAAG